CVRDGYGGGLDSW
nr:immunoglobulin heavy chain junction region [Macaca mulatta]MOY18067.1 immunoglobulin heavy chain junction region [Macaca mulatta]MOY18123.1 immunoglobulin heavy chain junction region [Macaca mulatta]MOY18419.1 immunoglobulin heavy chain junction region [Macaca mulatta]MOY18564.1 immunoglobulin heavy chain junction region [Macaca mulatta]